jgi:hypothetical protein
MWHMWTGLVVKPGGKVPLLRPVCSYDNIKTDLTNRIRRRGLDSLLRMGKLAGCYTYGGEPLGSIKFRGILDYPRNATTVLRHRPAHGSTRRI